MRVEDELLRVLPLEEDERTPDVDLFPLFTLPLLLEELLLYVLPEDDLVEDDEPLVLVPEVPLLRTLPVLVPDTELREVEVLPDVRTDDVLPDEEMTREDVRVPDER